MKILGVLFKITKDSETEFLEKQFKFLEVLQISKKLRFYVLIVRIENSAFPAFYEEFILREQPLENNFLFDLFN